MLEFHFDKLLAAAYFYQGNGLLVAPINNFRNIHNFNETNVLKAPSINIEELESKHTISQLLNNNRGQLTGLGARLGDENLCAIDVDGCSDPNFIPQLCVELGLGFSYEWIMQSGSKNGFHILFKCKDAKPCKDTLSSHANCRDRNQVIFYNGSTNAYFQEKKSKKCLKIEFKWSGFLVLPPSLHNCSQNYSFLHGNPKDRIQNVDFVQLILLKNKYCSMPTTCSIDGENTNCSYLTPIGDERTNSIYERYSASDLGTLSALKILNIENNEKDVLRIRCLQVSLMIYERYNYNVVRRFSANIPFDSRIFGEIQGIFDTYRSLNIYEKLSTVTPTSEALSDCISEEVFNLNDANSKFGQRAIPGLLFKNPQ